MDIGTEQIVATIASSTTGYLVTFSPLFLFIGGLVLAVVVIYMLLSIFKKDKDQDFDPFDS